MSTKGEIKTIKNLENYVEQSKNLDPGELKRFMAENEKQLRNGSSKLSFNGSKPKTVNNQMIPYLIAARNVDKTLKVGTILSKTSFAKTYSSHTGRNINDVISPLETIVEEPSDLISENDPLGLEDLGFLNDSFVDDGPPGVTAQVSSDTVTDVPIDVTRRRRDAMDKYDVSVLQSSIDELQGIVAHQEEQIRVAKQKEQEQIQPIIDSMGVPTYLQDANLGVDTKVMNTEDAAIQQHSEDTTELGAISELPAVAYTENLALAKVEDINQSLGTEIVPVSDPETQPGVQIIQDSQNNDSPEVSDVIIDNVDINESTTINESNETNETLTISETTINEGNTIINNNNINTTNTTTGVLPPPPGGTVNSGIQPGAGYTPIYGIQLAIFFNSSSNPDWDPTILPNLQAELGTSVPIEELYKQTLGIFDKFGPDLLIPALKYTMSAGTSLVLKQYHEILQLYMCLQRNMALGKRVPSVGVSIGDLINFGNEIKPNGDLANSTATEGPEALPTQTGSQKEQAVRDSIEVSETTKVFGGGAPLQKNHRYWRGEAMSSRAVTSMNDGLKRASINTGAQSVYGRGSLVINDDVRPRSLNVNVRPSLRVPNMPNFTQNQEDGGCVIKF